jgi:hypothetical protein
MNQPSFLVEAADGNLYGYERTDLLKIDLASNTDEPPRRVFRLDRGSLAVAYQPIEITDLLTGNLPIAAPPNSNPPSNR